MSERGSTCQAYDPAVRVIRVGVVLLALGCSSSHGAGGRPLDAVASEPGAVATAPATLASSSPPAEATRPDVRLTPGITIRQGSPAFQELFRRAQTQRQPQLPRTAPCQPGNQGPTALQPSASSAQRQQTLDRCRAEPLRQPPPSPTATSRPRQVSTSPSTAPDASSGTPTPSPTPAP